MLRIRFISAWLALLALACSSGGDNTVRDRAAAVREALAIGSPLTRLARLSPLLEGLSREDAGAVAAVYTERVSTLGELDIVPFVDAWVRVDREAALAGIEAWPYALKRQAGLRAALLGVASREPVEAVDLFERLVARHPRLKADFRVSLVTGWAASDPVGLRAYLLGLSADEMGPPLGVALGSVARFHGIERLLTWSEALIDSAPAGETQAKAFRKAARTATRRDPRRAAQWVLGHAPRDGASAVAEAWILMEPEAALAWLESEVPAEGGRAKALELAFGRWLHEDEPAARGWITSVELSPFHDTAVATYARRLGRRAPEEAVEWCGKISAPESRDACFVSVARGWLSGDAAAGEAWLEASPLDAAGRASVRDWVAAKQRRKARPPSKPQGLDRGP